MVPFYTNDFDTTTQGVDLVATYGTSLFGGATEFSLTCNWTDTEVDRFNPDIIDDTRVRQLEDSLPDTRFALIANQTMDAWRGLIRVNYYGDYYEAHTEGRLTAPFSLYSIRPDRTRTMTR